MPVWCKCCKCSLDLSFIACFTKFMNFTAPRALQPVATCRQSPYLHKPAIIIMTSFSL